LSEDIPVISGTDKSTITGNLLTSMLGAALLGILVGLSGMRFYAEPISEQVYGISAAVANTVIFVVLATVGALFVIALLKYGRENLLRYILIVAFVFIGFVIVVIFGSVFLVVFLEVDAVLASAILFAFILTSALAFIMVDADNRRKNGTLLVIGSGIGAFLAFVLGIWTSILLLIGISIYDYFSVKRGPIRTIVELTDDDPDRLGALAVSSAEWDIGLGDVAFYGMMTVVAILNFGYLSTLFTTIGIIAGFRITLRMLETRGLMPGLPIPVGLGLLGMFLGFLLRFFFPFIP
jgi:presenilin-like A22 family membrane protease